MPSLRVKLSSVWVPPRLSRVRGCGDVDAGPGACIAARLREPERVTELGGAPQQVVTIAIIARNEEANIVRTIESLAGQTLFAGASAINLIVYANGCTDRTAECARMGIERALAGKLASSQVVDSPVGGKSRSWNKVVHEVAPADTDVFLFMDADIVLADDRVCADMLDLLRSNDDAVACTGRPTKSLVRKKHKSFIERLSLRVSENSRADRSINGSLYCIEADAASAIWLPDQTPGEDGFLNAMVRTRGFSRPDDARLVTQLSRTTHYYDAPDLWGTLGHEKRMIVGTMVNIWIFEHLWSLNSKVPLGPMVGELNQDRPGWVDDLITSHSSGKRWVVRKYLITSRMPKWRGGLDLRFAAKVALGTGATALNVAACMLANRALRRSGAAASW